MRILVVDDDLHSREGLRVLLVREGHHVATAADGLQAIRRLKDNPFEMAIIDLHVPGLRGLSLDVWDLVRIARAFEPGAMVVVTAPECGPEIRSRAAAMGVDECLEKPLDPARLRAIARAREGGPSREPMRGTAARAREVAR
jgi:DNA-binding response OmpR family regulator